MKAWFLHPSLELIYSLGVPLLSRSSVYSSLRPLTEIFTHCGHIQGCLHLDNTRNLMPSLWLDKVAHLKPALWPKKKSLVTSHGHFPCCGSLWSIPGLGWGNILAIVSTDQNVLIRCTTKIRPIEIALGAILAAYRDAPRKAYFEYRGVKVQKNQLVGHIFTRMVWAHPLLPTPHLWLYTLTQLALAPGPTFLFHGKQTVRAWGMVSTFDS